MDMDDISHFLPAHTAQTNEQNWRYDVQTKSTDGDFK